MKNISALVVGMGKSGIAAAENAAFALERKYLFYDKKTEDQIESQLVQFFMNQKVNCYFGKEPASIDKFDLLVVSPGVSLEVETDQKRKSRRNRNHRGDRTGLAHRKGNLCCDQPEQTGKTTTTVLTGEIFKAAGRRTEVVGNVGRCGRKKKPSKQKTTPGS